MSTRVSNLRGVGCVCCVWVAFVALAMAGCGQKVEQKKVDPLAQVPSTDLEKVKGYLKAAGVDGEVLGANESEDGTHWVVDIQRKVGGADGKRGMPLPPDVYRVDKDGKVTHTGQ